MGRRLATPLTAYVIAVVTVLLLAASIPLAHVAKVSPTNGGFLLNSANAFLSCGTNTGTGNGGQIF